MLPNCLLSLANPKAEKCPGNDLCLAEIEKSDLIFCCHRRFAFIIFCIFLLSQHTKTLYFVYFLLYLPTCICIFSVDIVYIFSITFFHSIPYNYRFLCFPSVVLIPVFHSAQYSMEQSLENCYASVFQQFRQYHNDNLCIQSIFLL